MVWWDGAASIWFTAGRDGVRRVGASTAGSGGNGGDRGDRWRYSSHRRARRPTSAGVARRAWNAPRDCFFAAPPSSSPDIGPEPSIPFLAEGFSEVFVRDFSGCSELGNNSLISFVHAHAAW